MGFFFFFFIHTDKALFSTSNLSKSSKFKMGMQTKEELMSSSFTKWENGTHKNREVKDGSFLHIGHAAQKLDHGPHIPCNFCCFLFIIWLTVCFVFFKQDGQNIHLVDI